MKDERMTVRELVAILQALPEADQDLPVTTHANNHTSHYDSARVVRLVHDADGKRPSICIGNLSRMRVNYPNDWASEVLDGGKPIPQDWRSRDWSAGDRYR